tara:strand:+ start:53 stop:487 length:435 start_codon:yes stop_codon:yes gene_type:complete
MNLGGRPKETFQDAKEKFPTDWFDLILELYSEGASDVEIKGLIWRWRGSFSNDLWDRWMKEEPEFSETIKQGRVFSNCWWEKKGRKNLENKDFSATLFYMNMKNRFGWADKLKQELHKTTLDITETMTDDELESRIKTLKSKIG